MQQNERSLQIHPMSPVAHIADANLANPLTHKECDTLARKFNFTTVVEKLTSITVFLCLL